MVKTSINRKKDLWYIRMEDEFVNNVLFITLSRFFYKKNTRYKNYKIYRENFLLRKNI